MQDSDDADDICQRMQRVRGEVKDDVQDIMQSAKKLTDWRYHVKNHPWAFLGAAVAAGFLLVPRRKTPLTAGAQELAALLKKNNIPLGNVSASKKGLVATALATATPVLARMAMTLATRKLHEHSHRWAGEEAGHPAERINIPR